MMVAAPAFKLPRDAESSGPFVSMPLQGPCIRTEHKWFANLPSVEDEAFRSHKASTGKTND